MIKAKTELFYMRDHVTPNALTWGQAIDLGIITEQDYVESVWAFLRIDAPTELRDWWQGWAPPVRDNPSLPALVHKSATQKLQEKARDLMRNPQAMKFVMFDAGIAAT